MRNGLPQALSTTSFTERVDLAKETMTEVVEFESVLLCSTGTDSEGGGVHKWNLAMRDRYVSGECVMREKEDSVHDQLLALLCY